MFIWGYKLIVGTLVEGSSTLVRQIQAFNNFWQVYTNVVLLQLTEMKSTWMEGPPPSDKTPSLRRTGYGFGSCFFVPWPLTSLETEIISDDILYVVLSVIFL